MSEQQCKEEMIKAFEMMWGKFDEPVMLIHRDRTILVVNEACKAFGGVPGNKCNAVQPEKHRGCKANQALDKNETVSMSYPMRDDNILSYWIPVNGVPDYFIHFGIGTAEAYKKMVAAAKVE